MEKASVYLRIEKRYKDGVMFVLNTQNQCIDYFREGRYKFSICNMFSVRSFVQTNLLYEKVLDTKNVPDVEKMKLTIVY